MPWDEQTDTFIVLTPTFTHTHTRELTITIDSRPGRQGHQQTQGGGEIADVPIGGQGTGQGQS